MVAKKFSDSWFNSKETLNRILKEVSTLPEVITQEDFQLYCHYFAQLIYPKHINKAPISTILAQYLTARKMQNFYGGAGIQDGDHIALLNKCRGVGIQSEPYKYGLLSQDPNFSGAYCIFKSYTKSDGHVPRLHYVESFYIDRSVVVTNHYTFKDKAFALEEIFIAQDRGPLQLPTEFRFSANENTHYYQFGTRELLIPDRMFNI